MGRAEQIDQIEAAIRRKATLSAACAAAGINARTLARWRAEEPSVNERIQAAMRGEPAPVKSETVRAWGAVASASGGSVNVQAPISVPDLSTLGFYEFLTSPTWCALDLSPAVRAIALASEGRADEIRDDALCVQLFGCSADYLPRKVPRVVVLRSGGQCGKTSRLGAPKVLHGAISAPLPNVLAGQQARALITAPDVDLATAALNYCRGFVFNAPALRSMLTDDVDADADEDDIGTAYRIGLKRPDGKLVEVKIKAANRGGTGGRSRSLTGALMDEVCFFLGSDYRVNDVEIFGAIEQRVVPGGQTWLTSSPNIADYGILEEFVANEWGKHETALVVLASTRLMFPGWDPHHEIEGPMRKRDPDRARREIDGLPLDAHETAFYSPASIRAAEAKPASTAKVKMRGAGGDFAFVRNSSVIAIAEAYEDGTFAVTNLDERKPRQGRALRPSIVCAQHAAILLEAEVYAVVCDGHYRESVREHFAKRRARCPACGAWVEAPRAGGEWTCEIAPEDREDLGEPCGFVWVPTDARSIAVLSGPDGVRASEPFVHGRDGLNEGLVKLPQSARLSGQLRAVEGKPRPGVGQSYAIRQPEQRNAGPGGTMAHGDLVSAAMLSLWRVGLGRESPRGRRASFGRDPDQMTP